MVHDPPPFLIERRSHRIAVSRCLVLAFHFVGGSLSRFHFCDSVAFRIISILFPYIVVGPNREDSETDSKRICEAANRREGNNPKNKGNHLLELKIRLDSTIRSG